MKFQRFQNGAAFLTKKILVADDEPLIVDLVRRKLEARGYLVCEARNGREALAQVQAEKPDLVVLDVMMPYMDGLEVLQNLRKVEATRFLPIIVLSAYEQDRRIWEKWNKPLDMLMIKPFDPVDLVNLIDTALAATETD